MIKIVCGKCDSEALTYELINGQITELLCTLCLGEALLDVVTNNSMIVFTREGRSIRILRYTGSKKDSIGE